MATKLLLSGGVFSAIMEEVGHPRKRSWARDRKTVMTSTRGGITGSRTPPRRLSCFVNVASPGAVRQHVDPSRPTAGIFVIEGMETYLFTPRDPADLDLLIEAVRPQPRPMDLDVVVGVLGPLAPPAACGGLAIPIVAFDQLYSFDRDTLLGAIPRPDDIAEKDDKRFRTTAAELLDRILQITDNVGATDQHRALNYLSVRYPAIYARTAAAHTANASLTAVDVRPSRLSGVRTVVDVVFSYTHRRTDVTERYFVRVDVTEEFPFLVTKLSPYYDR
jgi:hypothetical protein